MIQIRPWQQDDLPTLKRLSGELHEAVRSYAPELPSASVILDDYFSYVIERMTHSGGTMFVAEEAGRLIGHVAVYGRIPPDRDEDQTPYSFIAELYVSPDAQGGGVGRLLITEAENYARALGAPRIELFVVAGNTPARAFYVRMGYRERTIICSKTL